LATGSIVTSGGNAYETTGGLLTGLNFSRLFQEGLEESVLNDSMIGRTMLAKEDLAAAGFSNS
jgi:hypothetical protein